MVCGAPASDRPFCLTTANRKLERSRFMGRGRGKTACTSEKSLFVGLRTLPERDHRVLAQQEVMVCGGDEGAASVAGHGLWGNSRATESDARFGFVRSPRTQT